MISRNTAVVIEGALMMLQIVMLLGAMLALA